MVSGHRDIGVGRQDIEQPCEHLIEVANRVNLTRAQEVELFLVEEPVTFSLRITRQNPYRNRQ
jgi:hypothetical protein